MMATFRAETSRQVLNDCKVTCVCLEVLIDMETVYLASAAEV